MAWEPVEMPKKAQRKKGGSGQDSNSHFIFLAVIIFLCFMWLSSMFSSCSSSNTEEPESLNEAVAEDKLNAPSGKRKHSVSLEIDCERNVMFSKYDIEVALDGEVLGTIDHGGKDTYDLKLAKGKHTLRVTEDGSSSVDGKATFKVPEKTELTFKVTCTNSQVEIEEVIESDEAETDEAKDATDTEDTGGAPSYSQADQSEQNDTGTSSASISEEEPTDSPNEALTVDNSSDLKAFLSVSDPLDSTVSRFVQNNTGKTIEFDGNIATYSSHEGAKTRFDFLIHAGDYSPDSVRGPEMQFEDCNIYDLNTDMDTIPQQQNVHVVATILEYDSNTGIVKLDPQRVTSR